MLALTDWAPQPGVVGQIREMQGMPTIFHWHCGVMMRRIVPFQRPVEGAPARKLNSSGWICPVCNTTSGRLDFRM
jgi:hypothetical protein